MDVEIYDGASWNLVRTINTDQGNGWAPVNIGFLNLTITGPIQIRFTVTENSPGTAFYNDILIDDIEIKEAPNLGVNSFIGIQNGYCNASVDIAMVVENKTSNVERDVPWEVFSDGAVVASGVIPMIMPNATDTVQLSLGGVGPAGPNATIEAYTNYPPDQTPGDDTLSATFGVSYTGLRANVTAQVGCAGGSDGEIVAVGQDGIPPYSFAWSNNLNTGTVNGLSAGSYTVTVTDDIGCSTTAQLALQDPPSMSFSATGTDLACNGDNSGVVTTTVSGGVPGYTYQWSNGSLMSELNGVGAGTYTVSVTDNNGCVLTETVTLTEPVAVLAMVSDNANGTATASGSGGTAPYTYQWDPNANNQTTAMATGIQAGQVYYVVVTDADGCSDVFSFQASRIVSATGVEAPELIRLYPNPTQGNAFLEWETATINTTLEVSLTTITGQVIWSEVVAADQLIELPTANLPTGVYNVQATDGQTQWSKKLVVTQ